MDVTEPAGALWVSIKIHKKVCVEVFNAVAHEGRAFHDRHATRSASPIAGEMTVAQYS